LDVVKAFAEFGKEAKKRYRCDCLLRIMSGVNKPSSKLLNKTIALRKKLSPSSPGSPEERSISDLQHETLEVKGILENMENFPGSIETRDRIT